MSLFKKNVSEYMKIPVPSLTETLHELVELKKSGAYVVKDGQKIMDKIYDIVKIIKDLNI